MSCRECLLTFFFPVHLGCFVYGPLLSNYFLYSSSCIASPRVQPRPQTVTNFLKAPWSYIHVGLITAVFCFYFQSATGPNIAQVVCLQHVILVSGKLMAFCSCTMGTSLASQHLSINCMEYSYSYSSTFLVITILLGKLFPSLMIRRLPWEQCEQQRLVDIR